MCSLKEKLKKTVPIWIFLLLIGALGTAAAVSFKVNKTVRHQFGKMVFGGADLQLQSASVNYSDANTISGVDVSVNNTDTANSHDAKVVVTLEGFGATNSNTATISAGSSATVTVSGFSADVSSVTSVSIRLEQVA